MTKRSKFLLLSGLILFPALLFSQGNISRLEAYLRTKNLVNISILDASIRIDLKYASADNFTKTVLYDTLSRAYLHPLAAKKLVAAQKYLKETNPGLTLLVYDATRPLSVQAKMYEAVRNTRHAAYVANPARTGLHNYGMAVDLTICDRLGKPLDMGTVFDYLGSAAGINREEELIRRGVLTKQQVDNRKLLRKVMTRAGFQTIRGEWWHFNAVSLSEARKSYKVIK